MTRPVRRERPSARERDAAPSPSGAKAAFISSDWAWIAGLSLAATGTTAALSTRLFGRVPHVQDSIAQLFQARIFAGGHLVAPPPPIADFFQYHHVILSPEGWYSQYPPGHALSLVPGVWLGIPWLINPLLGGLAVAAIYLLGLETFGRSSARLAGLLALISPFFLLMSAEMMAHSTTLAALTSFLALHLRAARTGSRGAAVGSALALIWGILARPYSAVGFVIPVAIFSVWSWAKTRSPLALGSFALGVAAGVVLLLGYNAATTGNPLVFGYEKLYGPSHGIGFEKGTWGPPHTLARGLTGFFGQIRALHDRLFAWPFGSLWPLLIGVLPLSAMFRKRRARASRGVQRGRRGGALDEPVASVDRSARRPEPNDASFRWLLLAIPLSLGLVHVFYWYRDQCFGPRYWFEGLGAMLLLSAVGLLRLRTWIAAGFGKAGIRNPVRAAAVSNLVWVVLLVLAAFSGFAYGWPPLFRPPDYAVGQPPESPYRQASYFTHFSPQYWGVDAALGRIVARGVEPPALVFCAMIEEPIDDIAARYLWFGSAFAHQDPFLESSEVIYAHDLGARNAELISLFPNRRVYRYTGSIQSATVTQIQ